MQSNLLKSQTAFGAAVGFSVATLLFAVPSLYRYISHSSISQNLPIPTPFSSASKKKKIRCLGFEMGGTTCKVALGEKTLDENGKVIDVEIITKFTIKTKDNPEETVQALIDCVMDSEYEEVGIAHFGPLELNPERADFGKVTTTPKEGWSDFRSLATFKAKLQRKTKTTIETDVNAAALAEFFLGGHKVKQSLSYITIGTGVGVGLVIDGKPVHGLIHPEGGHTTVVPHELDKDFKGVCPKHGRYCVEGMINNIAIAARRGIKKEEIHTLPDDDTVWEIVGHYLGTLCANIVLISSPEVIVLGGGVIKRKAIYPHLLKSFTHTLNGYLDHPKIANPEDFIKISILEDVGLKGAMVL